MNALEAALRRIATGGFAVSARAEPRFTRDIDAAVMVDNDADSEDLVRSLLASRYRLLASVEQDETGRLAPHLVALVRAGARFERGVLAERPEVAAA